MVILFSYRKFEVTFYKSERFKVSRPQKVAFKKCVYVTMLTKNYERDDF